MSGDDTPRQAAAPHAFSAADVRELSGRRTKPVAAVTRLKKAVPTGPIGKLQTDRPRPPRVSRTELATMRRATGRSVKMLDRLTPSDLPAERYEPSKLDRAPAPDKRPPLKQKTKTKTKAKVKERSAASKR